METIDYVQMFFSLAALVVSILILIKTGRKSENEQDRKLSEKLAVINEKISRQHEDTATEFERNRREQSLFQSQMRAETKEELDKMAERLDRMRSDNYDQMQRIGKIVSDSVFRLQESNEKKLDQMRETVDEKLTATLGTRLDASFKTVSEQLENVYKSLGEMKELSTGVTDNVTSLNRVLTNVKARGTWAEVQLRAILDQTIPSMYVENYSPNPSSKERVEFAVRIPSGEGTEAYLPIDSKFPMEDYVRYCAASEALNAEAASAALKALENTVLSEARMVSKYIDVPKTTPYAILYLATEGLYAEIISSKSGLAERIQREFNIMIAGPTTITALLNSLSMGYRAIAVNEKANEVRRLLAAARQQYAKFGDVLQKASKKIDEAGKVLSEAQDRNRIIAGKLKNVEEMDSTEADSVLGIISEE
ncbi:MAG: DNA recombination protein RmuC [Clostridia bacterium]|nr:DNA recombination protein RmuC [Clostridia bacterium]